MCSMCSMAIAYLHMAPVQSGRYRLFPIPRLNFDRTASYGVNVFLFSISLFGLVGISLLLTGAVYLTLSEFMPYHSAAVQMAWEELDANMQGLILGFLKGLGSGAFVAGVATLLMVGMSLARGPGPFLALLPIVATGYSTLLCYATYTVSARTPGDPPLIPIALLVVASMMGSAALIHSQRRRPRRQSG